MKTLWILPLLAAGALSVHAADLTALGNWTENISAFQLIAGAGSSLQNPESVSGVVALSVSNPSATWRVLARQTTGSWNSQVGIWVKRTSDGSGTGTVAGGSAYVQLTAGDTEIFSGTLARNDISLQFKVTGLALTVAPGTYQSPIVFTVVSP